MNDMIHTLFADKKADGEKLLSFGFERKAEGFTGRFPMGESGFTLLVSVVPPRGISATVYDDGGEVYTLHLVDEAVGGFVGRIRAANESLLRDIAEQCFTHDVFKAKQSQAAARYAKEKYGDELEFLWADLPDAAVLRRKDSRKWYAVFMTVGKNKLGLDGAEKAEILDVRVAPEELPKIADYKSYFPGYHMNKKHWLTILLDGSVDIHTVYRYLDSSYLLAKK